MAGMSRKGKHNRKAKQKQAFAAQANSGQQVPASPGPTVPVEGCTKFNFLLDDLRKEKAAQLLAEGNMTVEDVARAVGVTKITIYNWRKEPGFLEHVEEIRKHLADLSLRFPIARKLYRLANLNERLLQMQRICDARAAEAPAKHGGDSGLLVRRLRTIGRGENERVIEEYVFDSALVKEMRETEKQAAEELGDIVKKLAPTTPDGKDEYTGIPTLDLEEFRKLPIGERIKLLRAPIRTPSAHRDESPPAV